MINRINYTTGIIALIITLNVIVPFTRTTLVYGTLGSQKEQSFSNPKINIPFNLSEEKEAQKSVDAGHSPWKLDPAFVAQVFVSLKISPEGIKGDYPIDYKEFKVIENNGKESIIEVNDKKSPIKKVYLKRLIKQDNTGIWTVVGYDPK